jgi:hypothetical protein
MTLISRISTCTFYLTKEIRMNAGFKLFVNDHLNMEKYETFEGLLSNFIEIFNQLDSE